MPSSKHSSKAEKTVKHDKKVIAVNDSIEDIEKFLTSTDLNDSSEKKIAKELFSDEKIQTKTDLTDRQIALLTRGYFLAEELDDNNLTKVFDTFIRLRVSRKRKSRAEFIEALKGMDEVGKQATLFGGMFGGNR